MILKSKLMSRRGVPAVLCAIAIGSGVGAGLHVVWLFSLSLAAGIVLMFAGFLRASRAPRTS
jgi:hypothetical protein